MPARSLLQRVLAALFAASVAAPLPAQDAASADTAARAEPSGARRPERISLATSAAFGSSPSGWLGRTPGRDVFITAMRATWRIAGRDEGASLGYFSELMPLAIVTSNPTDVLSMEECVRRNPEWRGRRTIPAIDYFERCATNSASAAGAGVTPLGLVARVGRSSGVALTTELFVGGILFDKSMPYPNTNRFNYIVSAGTSLELPLRRRSVLSVGYQMHHLSNGGRGEFNPGVLAHAIQLGIARRR